MKRGFTCFFFFFKQKTAYELTVRDWSSDVCSSDLAEHGNAVLRAEIRRMTEWFDIKLFREAVEPLMNERMRKRLVSRESPDTRVLREAMRIASEHLDYLDYLLDHRRWLAGPGLSLADFTAAGHLSVIDYLGALDWRGHKQTKDWYAVMKSRPA